ncbi:hypothetical protein [Corynebacterium variabile]|uniref:hypothetical protein n=1 Tax=Corynebacterium variabile TaxID=1727 RepID=UPI003BB64DB0
MPALDKLKKMQRQGTLPSTERTATPSTDPTPDPPACPSQPVNQQQNQTLAPSDDPTLNQQQATPGPQLGATAGTRTPTVSARTSGSSSGDSNVTTGEKKKSASVPQQTQPSQAPSPPRSRLSIRDQLTEGTRFQEKLEEVKQAMARDMADRPWGDVWRNNHY